MTGELSPTELVLGLLDEVWNRGNLEAAHEYVSDRYTIHHDPGDPGEGDTLDLAQYQDRVRRAREAIPDQHFTVHEILGDAQKVIVTWFCDGRLETSAPNISASGRLTLSGATVYYVQNGRLTGHWQIWTQEPDRRDASS
jgi:predicted ester cyclase